MRGLLIALFLTFTQVLDANSATTHEAAKKGDLTALAAALNAGADVNGMSGGATPLYFAAARGHLEATKLLVTHGADVNIKTKFGSPLMAASARDTPELVILLLSNGADPNADLDSRTALHVAAERGCLGCVKALVDAGANVNAQQRTGSGLLTLVATPLHLAIKNGHSDVADYLVSHGVILPKPASISNRLSSADVVKGQAFFDSNCRACHSTSQNQGVKLGPNLRDIVGRDKASLDYSEYSEVLRAIEGVWTYEDLNTFLSGPTITTPGVNMEVQGAPRETDRVNLIAYLRTLSDNPAPIP
jgi:cytochrome c